MVLSMIQKRKKEYKNVRIKSVPTIEKKGLAAVSSSFLQHFAVHLEDMMSCIYMQKARQLLFYTKDI